MKHVRVVCDCFEITVFSNLDATKYYIHATKSIQQ